MERRTVKVVRAAFAQLAKVAVEAGIVTPGHEDLTLMEGDAANGRPYRLYMTEPPSTGLSNTPFDLSDGYLGDTAKDAERSLRMLARGVTAALEARR